jgi:CubicO group peptidase (beta-lactamase class C family)
MEAPANRHFFGPHNRLTAGIDPKGGVRIPAAFGGSGTFVWVNPEAGVACAVLTERASARCFRPLAWPALSDAVFDQLT